MCFVSSGAGIIAQFSLWPDISMSDEINYKNNPLNGVGLKALLTEIVDYYGFEILFAYLNINCFKTNPNIDSSVKFLKKTDWAREKVEAFYLYEFKNLPKTPANQLSLSPRARIIPDEHKPAEPAELNLQDAERLRIERKKKAAEWSRNKEHRSGSSKRFNVQRREPTKSRDTNRQPNDESKTPSSAKTFAEAKTDPWANWKNKAK